MQNVSYGCDKIDTGNVKQLYAQRVGAVGRVARMGSGVYSAQCGVRQMRESNNCCFVKSFSAEKPL